MRTGRTASHTYSSPSSALRSSTSWRIVRRGQALIIGGRAPFIPVALPAADIFADDKSVGTRWTAPPISGADMPVDDRL